MTQNNPDILLIVNPISGTKDKKADVARISELLKQSGYNIQVEYTTRSGHANEIARSAAERGINYIVAVGGDGTINEVASALTSTCSNLGIIPYGSGNGLARHLHIPLKPIEAARLLIKPVIQTIDYGTVNGRKYFCAFGLGFDASVAHEFAAQPSRGLSTYVRSALKVYRNYRASNYRVTFNDDIVKEPFYLISVCNASQYGNDALIAPQASVTDGMLDLVMVRPGSHFDRLIMTLKMFRGTIKDSKKIVYRKVGKVKIENQDEKNFHTHLDGEPIEMEGPLILECHPAQLNVIVPAKH